MIALAAVLLVAALDGRELVEKFECGRCHEGPRITAAAPEKHCVRCHQQIAQGSFPVEKSILEQWQRNVVHLRQVPSLDGMGRFRTDWLVAFLQEPHDLRPALEETMPRLAMNAEEARAIASWLQQDRISVENEEHAGSLERGEKLFHARACGSCHAFTGRVSSTGTALAPDLAHARKRLTWPVLVQWLRSPTSVKRDALMPDPGFSDEEARDVAWFVMNAPLAAPGPRVVPERLPVLERRVPFDEVNAKVFRRSCWHCHSDGSMNLGDGGPGNTGGLGFRGTGFNVATYPALLSGARDASGKRASIFRPVESGPYAGTPKLVAHLLARRDEETGVPVDGVRGMPLGLPSLSAEQLQLVETWVAQGHPYR